MSPELKGTDFGELGNISKVVHNFNAEKSDIFSLGLTVLCMSLLITDNKTIN